GLRARARRAARRHGSARRARRCDARAADEPRSRARLRDPRACGRRGALCAARPVRDLRGAAVRARAGPLPALVRRRRARARRRRGAGPDRGARRRPGAVPTGGGPGGIGGGGPALSSAAMPAETRFGLVVVGAGPGGYVAGTRAAQLGLRVAVVEREHLGGICANWGCIPTKALLRTAEIHHLLHHLDEFGLTARDVAYDAKKVVARSRAVAR